jgi:U3 small nucleolar RNA-associated protein 14
MKELEQKKVEQQFSSLKNPFVKITNSTDKKLSNYMVNSIPYNIQTKDQFENLNKTNLGPDTNQLSSFKNITQNKVVKFIGKVIMPMSNKLDLVKSMKINDIVDKATKKIVRTKSKI